MAEQEWSGYTIYCDDDDCGARYGTDCASSDEAYEEAKALGWVDDNNGNVYCPFHSFHKGLWVPSQPTADGSIESVTLSSFCKSLLRLLEVQAYHEFGQEGILEEMKRCTTT